MSLLRSAKIAIKKHNYKLFELLHPFHKAYRELLMRGAQRRYGVNPKKVIFSSFEGRSYNDNPRAISEKLHELCPEAEIVWLFQTSVIDKVEVPPYVKKQFYIQTWHGDRGFKKVGDDNEKLDHKVLRMEDQCAMMIAGSEFGKGTYRTAFRFKGEVLMDGCPRNDILLRNDPKVAADIRRRMGIEDGVKLLMYAPTYRDALERCAQDAVLDISRTLDHLEATTGEQWRCLYRAHYLNTGLNVREDSRLIDATKWPEMSELLLITDMLITDYSSCGGDFALLRRPLFLYHADAEEYLRESRSFYFDIEKSPFLVAHDQQELEALIDKTDAEAARENCEALDRFFGTTETGHASEAVCRYIMERMN